MRVRLQYALPPVSPINNKMQARRSVNKKRDVALAEHCRFSMGLSAVLHGTTNTAVMFNTSRAHVEYWRKKILDPAFHPNSCGGRRHALFSPEDQQLLENELWKIVQVHPEFTVKEFQDALKEKGYTLSDRSLRRIFKSWKWSWKCPDRKQVDKYKPENIEYYATYLYLVKDIPWKSLKFLDEAHFVPKDLHKRKVIGPIGEVSRLIITDRIQESFSATVMTTLSHQPNCIFDIREESNTQLDFFEFILYCLNEGHLSEGDILIIDNAPVHWGQNSLETLLPICDHAGVQIKVLPTYSPELNPCELVWSFVKTYVKNHRQTDLAAWEVLIDAFAHVTQEFILSAYDHCIDGIIRGDRE